MLRSSIKKWRTWKRRRTLLNIRREFAKAGYPLDSFRDSEIEAAVHWNDIEPVTLSAKIIHRTIERLETSAVASESRVQLDLLK